MICKKILLHILTVNILFTSFHFMNISSAYAEEIIQEQVYFYDDFDTGYRQEDTELKSGFSYYGTNGTTEAISRKVEDENGLLSMTDNRVGVEFFKDLGSISGKPKLVLELKVRPNVNYNAAYLAPASMGMTATPSFAIQRIPQNNGIKTALNGTQLQSYLLPTVLSTWYKITVVYDNETDLRDIYIDDGTTLNQYKGNTGSTYFDTGKFVLGYQAVFDYDHTDYPGTTDFDYIKLSSYVERFEYEMVNSNKSDLSEIGIQFNFPVNSSTLNTQNFQIDGTTIKTITPDAHIPNRYKLSFTNQLESETSYELTSSGIKDITGRTCDLTKSFTTRTATNFELGTKFSDPINLGVAVKTVKTTYTAYGNNAKGEPEIYFGIQGGIFYAINGLTGEINFSQKLNGVSLFSALESAPDGNVYFMGDNGKLYCYNPTLKTITIMSNFKTVPDAYYIAASEDQKLYISSYASTGGIVSEYDLATNTYKSLGVIKAGAQYCQGLAVTDKYLYIGTGVGAELQSVMRVDRSNGTIEEFASNLGGSTIYSVSVINGKVFAKNFGIIKVLDEATGTLIDQITATGKQYAMSKPSPYNSNLIYYLQDTDLYSYNIATKVKTKVISIPSSKERPLIGLDWVERNGEWVLGLNSDFIEDFYFYSPIKQSLSKISTVIDVESGPDIQTLEAFGDGNVYVGGYMYGISAYQTETDTRLFNIPTFHQAEGIGELNGKIYYGTYTGAAIYSYDPKLAINYVNELTTTGNPKLVYDIGQEQDRPYVLVKGGENTLLIGTIPDYGVLGGALTVYKENSAGSGSATTYRNLVLNHSVGGLAYKNGKIYMGTTISGGLGIDPSETQAQLVIIDEATMKIEKTVIPNIPGIGTTSAIIGQMSFGPDGLLWACSDKKGTVFAVDPDTLDVVKSVSTDDADMPATRRGCYIRWGKNGIMYTTAGYNLTAIDPESLQYKRLYDNVIHAALDEQGNIYYSDGSFLKKIEAIKEELLTTEIKTNGNVGDIGGTVTVNGTAYAGDTPSVDIIPNEGYVIESVLYGEIKVVSVQTGEYRYQTPALENKMKITVNFIPDYSALKVSSHSKIYQSIEEDTPFAISFATAKDRYGSYHLVEYGTVLSKTERNPEIDKENCIKIKATVSRNLLGQYGIKFIGNGLRVGKNYYTKAYAIYSNGIENKTVYGEAIFFTP